MLGLLESTYFCEYMRDSWTHVFNYEVIFQTAWSVKRYFSLFFLFILVFQASGCSGTQETHHVAGDLLTGLRGAAGRRGWTAVAAGSGHRGVGGGVAVPHCGQFNTSVWRWILRWLATGRVKTVCPSLGPVIWGCSKNSGKLSITVFFSVDGFLMDSRRWLRRLKY